MQPSTHEHWIAVARERATDADVLLDAGNMSIGCVYMAGYAVECSLKALLQRRGDKFPKRGDSGHNLRYLWEACGFRLSDLHDTDGSKTFFVQSWTTDLRYEVSFASPNPAADLIRGAKELSGWLQKKARRLRRPR